MRAVDLSGRTFERLNVLRRTDHPSGRVHWLCRCACGNVRVSRTDHLLGGVAVACANCERGD